MKFAKELEKDLVPEWQVKYLDYKTGKKKVKKIARAYIRANSSPPTPGRRNLVAANLSKYGTMGPFSRNSNQVSPRRAVTGSESNAQNALHPKPSGALGTRSNPHPLSSSVTPDLYETSASPIEIQSQNKQKPAEEEVGLYGSFVPTPPDVTSPFELPDPALRSSPSFGTAEHVSSLSNHARSGPRLNRVTGTRSSSYSGPQSAYEVGQTTTPAQKPLHLSQGHNSGLIRRQSSVTIERNDRPLLHRILSHGPKYMGAQQIKRDHNLQPMNPVQEAQKEFFKWIDDELHKVESFYVSKEDEAGARLKLLKEQLHVMRDRRVAEVQKAGHAAASHKDTEHADSDGSTPERGGNENTDHGSHSAPHDHLSSLLEPLEHLVDDVKSRVLKPRFGPNSKALQNLKTSPAINPQETTGSHNTENDRDYVRRPVGDEISYRSAKRKLKRALQEFYRGLELLKAYALLNRTAFRKINKKYDKAIDAHPPLRFMTENVNKSLFVTSDVLDNHIHAVEDLYSRYFERGNYKIAVGKLRSSGGRTRHYSGTSFRNGLLLGVGTVFAVQGTIFGAKLLQSDSATTHTQTSYLFQIYAGYFLGLYLFAWFCVACRIWARNRINYAFVFEFDIRHDLDFRELAAFPSFLLMLLGLFVWLNFAEYGSSRLFLYYPIALIVITVAIIFFPAPVLFHRSRQWFVYSHWRLLLAGLYPVEFRDFFLGDMYCSLTYSTSNLELFFCLYANDWINPAQCNSTHSRLLGFFAALPGIWRALQCIRRYYDTRNAFPHLANCLKYSLTIMYYVSLSLYRIDKNDTLLVVFIVLATVNAIYCSIWDVLMDWSLGQKEAKLLRGVRGYNSKWYYYAAMLLDPILRFNWIFYVLYTHDLQHSTLVSFFVSFSEITRRGIWTLFRVENEHCANVARFKASRDVPLPYELGSTEETAAAEGGPTAAGGGAGVIASSTRTNTTASAATTQTTPIMGRRRGASGADLERAGTRTSLRRRNTRTLAGIVADAHTQDFEKKRKPAPSGSSSSITGSGTRETLSDDDDFGMQGKNSSDDDEDEI